jgi:hypothetical protein
VVESAQLSGCVGEPEVGLISAPSTLGGSNPSTSANSFTPTSRWQNGYAPGLCTVGDAGSIPALLSGAAYCKGRPRTI